MAKLLNEKTIKQLITMSEANKIIDKTFQGFGNETVVNPPKVTLDLGETGGYPYHEGFVNAMPAYIGDSDIAGLKWVSGTAGKRKEAGLPFISALIVLMDPAMGEFISVMEGTHISNLRTGAQTAVSLKYLGFKDGLSIGLYGAGEQARFQIEAIADLFDIKELRVWNHRASTAEKFAEDMADYVKGDIIVCQPDEGEKAAQADILITVTNAQEPILLRKWVQPGTVVFPMGSFQEIDDDMILSMDKLVVDHPYQALNRGALKRLNSEGKVSEDDVFTTLGELAVGKSTMPDFSDELVMCIPIGTGAMDVAVAEAVYQKAISNQTGDEYAFVEYE